MEHGMAMQLRSACLTYAIELAKVSDREPTVEDVLACAKLLADYIKGQEPSDNMVDDMPPTVLH